MQSVKIKVECRLLTPMLSSGADQKKFELRATSIKSALRFWWRAFHPEDKKALYQKESRIFGNTDFASPFRIIIKRAAIRLWRPGDEHGWGPGLQYILFPINSPARRTGGEIVPARISRGRYGRPVAKPGSTFEIEITFPPTRDEEVIGDILCSLWLLKNLGGLGARNRRGCGCFKITELTVTGTKFIPDLPNFSLKKDKAPQNHLLEGLRKIWKRWETLSRANIPDFTCYHPRESEIWILWKNSFDAVSMLEHVGSKMSSFRTRNPFDEAKEMHTALSLGTVPNIRKLRGIKSYLGLPIIYNFKETFGNLYGPNLKRGGRNLQYLLTTVKVDESGNVIKDSAGNPVEGSGRRSSPLLFSCHDDGHGAWLVICHFPSPLLPNDEYLWFKANTGGGSLDVTCSPPISDGKKFAAELIKEMFTGMDKVACIKS